MTENKKRSPILGGLLLATLSFLGAALVLNFADKSGPLGPTTPRDAPTDSEPGGRLPVRRTTLPGNQVALASVSVTLSGEAELLVTDPQGRRTGVDPRTGITYSEIPEASYFIDQLEVDNGSDALSPPLKVFYAPGPLDGSYTIQVIGTGSGAYTLDILNYDELGDPSSAVASGQGETNRVDTYRMEHSSIPGAETSVVMEDK